MSTQFVMIDRETPMLLPPDLRDWIPENGMVHFILDAVETLDIQNFSVNQRGSGCAQVSRRREDRKASLEKARKVIEERYEEASTL